VGYRFVPVKTSGPGSGNAEAGPATGEATHDATLDGHEDSQAEGPESRGLPAIAHADR
jgi:hypothetical protein